MGAAGGGDASHRVPGCKVVEAVPGGRRLFGHEAERMCMRDRLLLRGPAVARKSMVRIRLREMVRC